uniref:Adrenomedullin 2a n=1 Tax=Nothobranchius rachovii TaxID=451742 RepID=A0A1A8RQY5_9TELE
MRSFLPLAVCCISRVSLQQLSALPPGELPDGNRLNVLNKLLGQKEEVSFSPESETNDLTTSPPLSQEPEWLPGFLRHPASGGKTASFGPAWAQLVEVSQRKQRQKRSHGQTHSRGGHQYPKNSQLMRVGCNLGTCQVQNLSHRLYQLIGQSGRDESSPINPRSPHSFG